METVANFIFLGSKITGDGDCSHEIKSHLLLGRKAMTNLDNILKSRDITLPTKVCLVKAMVFPVFMYRCESWTIKKAEPRRIYAFELWCWRRLLRVPWTARRSNQLFLKEISPEYSLERLMLKLKLQYFGHLMQGTDSLEKTLALGKIEGGRKRGDGEWDGWKVLPTWWHEFVQTLRVSDGQGRLMCCSPWDHKELETTELLIWTELLISRAISPLFSSSILGTYWPWGVHLSVSYLFALPYCSWSSQGKNTKVVFSSLLQWTMFCHNSLPWPTHLGWFYVAWSIISLS